MSRVVVGIMGSGEGAAARDVALAEELGELVAREGWAVLTGGRPAGVMQAAVAGARRVAGALTIGVLPTRDGPMADGIDVAVLTGLGEARNVVNVLTSRVVVTCGSLGAGTLSEAALAIKLGRPLVLLEPGEDAAQALVRIGAGVAVVDSPAAAIGAIRARL